MTGNLLAGNFIGTDATGTAAIANNVGLEISQSSDNTVGGTASGAGNVISGNTTDGILIQSGFLNTLVAGNQIGTNASGTAALGNGVGVYLETTDGNTIGGTAPGSVNVISGNNTGVLVENSSINLRRRESDRHRRHRKRGPAQQRWRSIPIRRPQYRLAARRTAPAT